MMLKGNVIVVTGGAGLLGKSFVNAIVDSGGIAVIADINAKMAQEVKDDLLRHKYDAQIEVVSIDITDKQNINQSLKEIHDKYGRIDALVNNAYPRNKNYGRKFSEVEYSDFSENISLNLGGYFLMSQQYYEFCKKQGYGNIVNIASIYGVVAPKFEIYEGTTMTMPVEYAVIKSGLIHLTKFMAKEFKGRNIRVNCLSPGGIQDAQPNEFLQKYKQQCLNKGMLDPKDMQGTLVYLLSDMSRYVNGQNIVVDDGFTL